MLVVASHNPGKVREIKALLAPHGIEPVERRRTGPARAGRNRRDLRRQCRTEGARRRRGERPSSALADDSGSGVEALDGAPGIYSARWAGPDKDFRIAMARVEQRIAREEAPPTIPRKFVCALSLAHAAWRDAKSSKAKCMAISTFPPRGHTASATIRSSSPTAWTQTFGEIDPAREDMPSATAPAPSRSCCTAASSRMNCRASASMSIGRSAPPNAPIAISTPMSAPRSTKRAGSTRSPRELEWTAQCARR